MLRTVLLPLVIVVGGVVAGVLIVRAAADPSPTPVHGLFVGVDRYPDAFELDLSGGASDARRFAAAARARLGVTAETVLVDKDATRDRILAALDALAEAVESGAVGTVVVGFAGHGVQVPDQAGGDELDGRDEAWLPVDATWRRDRLVRDDDLGVFLARVVRAGGRAIVLSDSCHAGGMIDGPAAGVAAFLACGEDEKALEGSGGIGGRLSAALVEALDRLPADATFGALGEELVRRFLARWPDADVLPVVAVGPGLEDAPLVGAAAPR